ncbi:MAG: MFS transporter [Proteobacteria bacterium]|nr:MFS transporter [Pseudomonadota bacterium]MBI3496631.1 MFS transporter [Pseudomonadota bacterium]
MSKAAIASTPAERVAAPHAQVPLLKDGRFLRIWIVGGVANTMRWLELLAVGIFVFDATDSAFLAAAVTALRSLPMLCLGAFAGALAERSDRRLLLIAGLFGMAAIAGVLALLAFTGRIAIWHIALGALANGLYWSGEMAVRRTMLGEIAGIERISAAMGLDSATANGTRMVGPIMGGLLFETVGLAGAYLIAATLYALAGLLAVSLTHAETPRPPRDRNVLANVLEGLRYARTKPLIAGTLAITVLMNFFGFPYSSLVPAIGRDELGLSAIAIGLLASAEGTGALLGSIVIAVNREAWPYARTFLIGSMLCLFATFLFSRSPWFSLAFAMLLVGGVGSAGFGAMQATIIFTQTPAELRSRVMGVLTMFIGAGPFGMLHVGLMANWLGASNAVSVATSEGFLLAILAALIWPALRQR